MRLVWTTGPVHGPGIAGGHTRCMQTSFERAFQSMGLSFFPFLARVAPSRAPPLQESCQPRALAMGLQVVCRPGSRVCTELVAALAAGSELVGQLGLAGWADPVEGARLFPESADLSRWLSKRWRLANFFASSLVRTNRALCSKPSCVKWSWIVHSSPDLLEQVAGGGSSMTECP